MEKFDEFAYFDGHRGVHIRDGIYKLEEPIVGKLIDIFRNIELNGFGVLYKWSSDEKTVQILYFKHGYEEREELYEALFDADFNNMDLHYYEPIDKRHTVVGGLY